MLRKFIRLSIAGALIAGMGSVFAVSAGAQTTASGATSRSSAPPAPQWTRAGRRAKPRRSRHSAGWSPTRAAAILKPVTEIRDQFKKKGEKAFDKLTDQIAAVDEFTFTTCPGDKVNVVAIDYTFQGMPATLKPGVTGFKLTNASQTEDHEMSIGKLLPANETMNVEQILALPEKKADKLFDESGRRDVRRPVGESGYTTLDLKAGHVRLRVLHPGGGKEKRRAARDGGHVRQVHCRRVTEGPIPRTRIRPGSESPAVFRATGFVGRQRDFELSRSSGRVR